MIKFFRSYVGSKAKWLERLRHYEGSKIVEPFCGSAIISANLASEAILNDLDPIVARIISRFDEQIVPDCFSQDDYFAARHKPDWWRSAYCLSAMAFSGVFRHSKNGFNVPVKKNMQSVSLRSEYLESLSRWMELSPRVTNTDYLEAGLHVDSETVLILDPPYEGCQAAYNKFMDYQIYWQFVRLHEGVCRSVVVFDNHQNFPWPVDGLPHRVNGKRSGGVDAMFDFRESLKQGSKGEDLFLACHPHLSRADNGVYIYDFYNKATGVMIELKSDYYKHDRTGNFFFERWSRPGVNGGPWQSFDAAVQRFIYWWPDSGDTYVFDTVELVRALDDLIKDLEPIDIPNNGYTTTGYKVPRVKLSSIYNHIKSK